MTKPSKIPEFKSIQEEAGFWDTHDTMDFADEFKTVEVTVNLKNPIAPKKVMSIRLDETDETKLKQLAETKGLPATTLARMWIKERLNNYKPLERGSAY
jgi:hypothetical protein